MLDAVKLCPLDETSEITKESQRNIYVVDPVVCIQGLVRVAGCHADYRYS